MVSPSPFKLLAMGLLVIVISYTNSGPCFIAMLKPIGPSQWRIQNFEKGVSNSATPTLAVPSFSNNAESAEFLSMLNAVAS